MESSANLMMLLASQRHGNSFVYNTKVARGLTHLCRELAEDKSTLLCVKSHLQCVFDTAMPAVQLYSNYPAPLCHHNQRQEVY